MGKQAPDLPASEDVKRYVSVKGACELLDCSVSTLANRRKNDQSFPRPYQVGRKLIWRRDAIEAWIEKAKSVTEE
jgi:predicted DNA-binding transcriptional regulator AlpA